MHSVSQSLFLRGSTAVGLSAQNIIADETHRWRERRFRGGTALPSKRNEAVSELKSKENRSGLGGTESSRHGLLHFRCSMCLLNHTFAKKSIEIGGNFARMGRMNRMGEKGRDYPGMRRRMTQVGNR